jgi:hypothetical protein
LEFSEQRGSIARRALGSGQRQCCGCRVCIERWSGGFFGSAATRGPAEGQRLGDGIARETIGTIGAADRLAGGIKPGDSGRHAAVNANASHVVVRDWRYLHIVAREVDAIGSQPIDHRAEGDAKLFRRNMAKAQPDTAVWRTASGLDLACNGVCGNVARHHVP